MPPAAPRPRRSALADSARARIAELEQPARGVLRRRAADSAERGWSANASSSPRGKSRRPPSVSATSRAGSPTARHGTPNAARSASAPPSSTRSCRAAAASTCASRSSDQLAYLTQALGALPDKPRARRTWQQAATRIEAYRFDHAVTDPRHALGSRRRRAARACAMATRPPRPPTRPARPRSPHTPARTPTRSKRPLQTSRGRCSSFVPFSASRAVDARLLPLPRRSAGGRDGTQRAVARRERTLCREAWGMLGPCAQARGGGRNHLVRRR